MKNITICALIAIAFLSACKKQYQGVDEPSFDVQTDSLVVSVNKPIVFRVTGNADRVTFYSGENGRNYDFKNRVKIDGKAQIQFKTVRQYGLGVGTRDTTLKLLISKDYNGQLNQIDIAKATWIEITDRAELNNGIGAPGTASARTPSGVVDISDMVQGDTAIYVAFRYVEAQSNQTKRAWNIFDFTIDNVLPDNSVVRVANWGDLAFAPITFKYPVRSWFVYATTAVPQSLMWGGGANTPDTEDWIISKPLFLNRTKRDAGVSIRNNPKSLLTDYTFDGFKTPGTYTVVFEAINATQWQTKEILKKITITVK